MKPSALKTLAVATLGLVMLLWFAPLQQASLADTQGQYKAQAPQAKAQPAAAKREWLSIQEIRIKPDMLTEWLEFQRKETIPALQKGGVKSRDAWQAGVFGESFQYVFVTPIENFAQYDSQNPIQRALGQEGAQAYGAKNRRFLAGSRTWAVQTRPDLGYAPERTGPPSLGVLTVASIAPGRISEFETYIKNDIAPVMKKAGVPGYLVSQTVFGGDASEFVTLRILDKFAELDQPPPTVRILGEQAASKLGLKTAGVVAHVERFIIRYNTDLSFRVTTTSEAR